MAPLLVAALGGCATVSKVRAQLDGYEVTVSGLAAPESEGRTSFVLLPGNPDTSTDDLQFREYGALVRQALEQRGFQPATWPDTPHVVVYITYGLGAPRTAYYQQYDGYEGPTTFDATTTGPGGTTRTTGTVSSPGYGSFSTAAKTVVDSWLSVEAIDPLPYLRQKRVVPVWRTVVSTASENSDLRTLMPMFVVAGRSALGRNTGKALTYKLLPSSPEVVAFREGRSQ